MPLLRVTYQRGAFTDEQKAQLAEKLTHAILVAEIGNDNPTARSLAYVIFDEVEPKTSWFVGGQLQEFAPQGGRFIFDVIYPFGAADQVAKTQLHKDINDIVASVLGVDGTFPNRAGDWVLIHEITEGNWGVSGQTVGIKDIHAVTKGSPERIDYFQPLLAAQGRMLEAYDFPTGAPGLSK
ncbi:MAG: tautomerase family protein [Chroococcidiopsidaceae cyanobacterium CP_BM_RX_35]|nr:tautomerase family protein [Chroococcidiopsidaceae cyanobacterium CP_BM_RX_35]